ncbi:fam-m protein [Plasmodium brasilianum]|uniref:Fam-m protein n=1 Tax=Plasmodium brasilianum TaxID=5824 RepID=A0ACB9YAP7_PLABR|nr:fam-m protein [Plasmodium brasilianum]
MDQNIKLLLFIKISTFILLTWIYYINSELVQLYNLKCTFNKSPDKNYNLSKRFDKKSYRILAKYKQNKDSNDIYLKEIFENNGENKKRNIFNNENCRTGKNKQSNRNLLNKAQYYIDVIDYNNGMFDGKNFHFEKKWLKKRDYDEFRKQKRRSGEIALKKIKFRSYGLGITIFSFFLFLGIGLAVLPKLPFLKGVWDAIEKAQFFIQLKGAIEVAETYVNNYLYVILFIVLMVILSAIVIIVIYKILRNNEKYEKIKLMIE